MWRCLPLLAVLLACAESSPLINSAQSSDRLGAWIPAPSATLLQAETSGLENPVQTMVEDRPAWDALWAQAWSGTPNPPAEPQIDFVLESVVVVGLGRRAGAGYSISFDSIVVTTRGGIYHVTAVEPGAGCPSMGISTPVHMVHAPGHTPILEWRIATVRRACGP